MEMLEVNAAFNVVLNVPLLNSEGTKQVRPPTRHPPGVRVGERPTGVAKSSMFRADFSASPGGEIPNAYTFGPDGQHRGGL